MRTADRILLALLLLALAFPAAALATLTAASTAGTLAAAHPAVLLPIIATVLILRSMPGPASRLITRLAGAKAARLILARTT